MSDKTGIEWTDATWNPVTGCTKVSTGCDHCYAETIAHRFAGTDAYPDGFAVTLRPERLDQPLRWKKPRMIFVNSMSDLFHVDIPDTYIHQVFNVMERADWHTFQILTKRHARMRSFVRAREARKADYAAQFSYCPTEAMRNSPAAEDARRRAESPPPNIWLGVSVENQQWADIRIPALLDTPAAVRFLSCEPLLGRVDLNVWMPGGEWVRSPDWVIVGGESGPGARPMHPDWARSLRDQCVAAGVPFHFKQRGEWTWNEPDNFRLPTPPFTERTAVMHPGGMTALTKRNPFDPFAVGHPNWATRIDRVGKRTAGRELDGRTWDEYPEAVQS